MVEHRPRHMLVTGGAGFIGANFIGSLQRRDPDVKVITLDSLTYAGSEHSLRAIADPDRHIFVRGDIGDARLVEEIFRSHPIDTVAHFAAESHVDRSILGPAPFIQTNIVGTFVLLEAARKAWSAQRSDSSTVRFHHVSTDEVFGSLGPKDGPFDEMTAYRPNSPYSASKASSDHLVRAYFQTYGLPVTLSNCSNNYGPLQHGEKFIPTVIDACRTGRPIPVYGDGSNRRDWLYVEDHCVAIEQVIRYGRTGETYCVGGDGEHANIDIARRVCRIMDGLYSEARPHDRLITFVKDRPGHDWRYAINASKIRRELGWKPAETLESGLARTVRWYLDQRRA